MNARLAGRRALVTGGGRGIGRAICRHLAEAGASVAVNYRRDADAAAEVVEAIRSAGGSARAYSATVDDHDALAKMVAEIAEDLGPIDLLVNNAGIASRGQSVLDTDPAELPRVMGVHAFGPHRLAQLVLPAMRASARGDIVMVSSTEATTTSANGAPYAMAKAAMEALALTLAREEEAHGIRVNVVAPGLVATDMGTRLVESVTGSKDPHELDSQYPFGRLCSPDDVASAVVFFASADASYVTRQRLAIDGGIDRDPILGASR